MVALGGATHFRYETPWRWGYVIIFAPLVASFVGALLVSLFSTDRSLPVVAWAAVSGVVIIWFSKEFLRAALRPRFIVLTVDAIEIPRLNRNYPGGRIPYTTIREVQVEFNPQLGFRVLKIQCEQSQIEVLDHFDGPEVLDQLVAAIDNRMREVFPHAEVTQTIISPPQSHASVAYARRADWKARFILLAIVAFAIIALAVWAT